MRKILAFSLILNALFVNAQIWEEPYLINPGSEHVQVTGQTIYLDENVADESIAIINYSGNPEDVRIIYSIPPNGGELTGMEVRKRGDSKCDLVNTKSQDYESINKKYEFDINIGGTQKLITLNIVNVNDNEPQFVEFPSTCTIKEDTLEVNCAYIVEDRDGDVEVLTWTINGESEHEIFKLDSEKVSDIRLKLNLGLKKKLDFTEGSTYVLDFEVSDQVHTANLRVVVQVEDIPNQPPTWIRIFQSQQFNEKESQIFTVEARDGDIGIDDDITYKITFDKDENWENYIRIDTNTGEISVEPIDRDAEQREIYKFTIIACEVQMSEECIDQEVTFIVNDINDHAPEITLNGASTLLIEESKISTIDTKITVKDVDSGENARYTLKLSSETGHEKAFTIAPTSGYQETAVNLFIVDAISLDYEDEAWQKFSFQLIAEEDVPSTDEHQPVTFNIELINRNDELPIFTKCEHEESTADVCVVEVDETFEGNTLLVTMKAEDRDIGGGVDHTLLGTYANRILKINQITGEIATQNLERPFDYETLPEVIVQVQAQDWLEGDENRNIVLSQLTIKLIDVNDETPTISVDVTNDRIVENRKDGEKIGVEITATDDDSTAELNVYINWETSYAIQNGRRVEDDVFETYKGCVVLDPSPENTGRLVKATLKIKETVKGDTPDFEKFDTLDLEIVARDEDQTILTPPNETKVRVQLYIDDLNDNEPVFDEIPALRVTEKSSPGTLIGYISASDKDVADKLEFSLQAHNGTEEGLAEINIESGRIEVTGVIDADKPIQFLYYIITVSDSEHDVTIEIEIEVLDTNDKNPVFGDNEITQVEIPEQVDDGTNVKQFIATDADRDEENNHITYSITVDPLVRRYFAIDSETGQIFVNYANKDEKLDRDEGIPPPPITITVVAMDNGGRSATITLTVVLTDINNNVPRLITTSLNTEESKKENDVLGTIEAKDDDEPNTDNSRIKFEIIRIEAMGMNKEADQNMFVLGGEDENAGKVNLIAGKDLREYFDDYEVTVKMSDYGVQPLSSEGSFTVSIAKFNFEDPKIENPKDGEIIYLSKSQIVGQPIRPFNGEDSPMLKANDQQGNKYSITFTVQDETGLITLTASRDYLTVTRTDLPDESVSVTITATIEGQPTTSKSITITLIFIDENISPTFEQNKFTMNGFVEESEEEQTFEFPAAKYAVDIPDLIVYYVMETQDSPFIMNDNQKPELTLNQKLDREEQETYNVVIQTSRQEGGTINPDESARINIEINLQDINDNAPEFESDRYYTIFLYDDKAGSVLTQIPATDKDKDDVLTYAVKSIDDSGSTNFPKFSINNQASVSLNSDASSTSTGYAILTISVTDTVHETTTQLEVYVVSEEKHIVKFVFENKLVDVEQERENIEQILMETFKSDNGVPYTAYIKRIINNNEESDTDENSDETSAEVYFIDTEKHTPIEKSQIEKLANDVSTFAKLEQQFSSLDGKLTLVSFLTLEIIDDNTVEVLRAWLIGVAVVLGSLCILLIVAFVLKTRSLTARLNKLSVTKYGSQESGLNRKVVPNTNRNALEGSNPAFNTEKQMPEFDRVSVGSGDSDLIGVENNPDFQRRF